jgi:hypothetical protein
MINKILSLLFPEPKSEIEMAFEKILSMTYVSNHSFEDLDPVNGSYFAVGRMKLTYASMGIDYMNIMFSKNGEDVVIKYKDEIIYYFNTKDEVNQIRKAIIMTHNKQKQRQRSEAIDEFNRL